MPDHRTRPYPTDLSDTEWAALQPLLPTPARLGRPLKWPRRLMVEAIFYLVRSGCAWRMLPRHFPPWPTVYSQFARWRRDGTLRIMHDRLRTLAHEAEGRSAEPSAAIVVSQTVRATGVGGAERGYDAAKKIAGRKRHLEQRKAAHRLCAKSHTATASGRGRRRYISSFPLRIRIAAAVSVMVVTSPPRMSGTSPMAS